MINFYQLNYQRLQALLGTPPEHLSKKRRFISSLLPDLWAKPNNPCTHTARPTLTFGHYLDEDQYMPDPMFRIRINPNNRSADVLSFATVFPAHCLLTLKPTGTANHYLYLLLNRRLSFWFKRLQAASDHYHPRLNINY